MVKESKSGPVDFEWGSKITGEKDIIRISWQSAAVRQTNLPVI